MINKLLFLVIAILIANANFAQTIQSIESVEYDASHNRFFISNSNSILQRDSEGTLTYFGNGAASYGMEVMGNTLFVIQGGGVQGYDLVTENQVMSINIPEASFLNGMTNNGVDKIYVTDFSASKIHEIDVSDLENPTSQVIVANTNSTPNGIVFDENNNRLIFVNWGSNAEIKSVDLSNYNVTTLVTTPYSNIDGIDEDNDGNYYISYWSSGTHISKYDADFVNSPETIDVSGLSSPADICYAKEIDSLAIPHSGNQLTFLSFESNNPCENGLWDYQLGETWVDCGGDCGDCDPHNNGCQDEGESGIDCGGSSGIDCASLCNDGLPNGWEYGALNPETELPFDCDPELDPIDYLNLSFSDCGVGCEPCDSLPIGVDDELLNQKNHFLVFPNPVTDDSRISFYLEKTSYVNLSIYDLQGKLIYTLLNEIQLQGKHQFLLGDFDFPQVFVARLNFENRNLVLKLYKN